MGWWGIAWTLSRCALNASAGIAKRKQFFIKARASAANEFVTESCRSASGALPAPTNFRL